MLKHPSLTVRRISQFVTHELQPRVWPDREPLDIEFCPEPHADEKRARSGPWERVDAGFRYGPAYRTVWFRVRGTTPERFAGGQVGLMAEVGGERTVWKDGSPYRGLDVEHHVFPIWNTLEEPIAVEGKAGKPFEALIQVYTRNPQCRVHLRELPREPEVETVQGAWLVAIDREVKALTYDMEFAVDLLSALDENEPAYHTLLRALNAAVNNVDFEDRSTLPKCRKSLQKALSSLSGEHRHALTPVGHAHLDTAWLWPIDVTQKKMAHTAANQLALIEEYPNYVFVHSQAAQYEWVETEYPKLFERIRDATRKGRWEPVGSMWIEADCNLTGGESLVRQFLYGRKYFREKLGVSTVDMWLPDVFGYSAALPQILAQFGIEYFLTQKISWNQFNKFPHNTFWWQGIDGTQVWSHFPPADTYIGDCTPSQILKSVRQHKDHGRSNHSLYVFGFGDGGGGPTERHLEFLTRASHTPLLPQVQFGKSAAEFFRVAKSRSRDLPVWVGELYLEMHRGTYTSQAAVKKGNRLGEFLLRDAELLCCFSPKFPKNYPAAQLEGLWKLLLLNQFHDILPGSSVREVYVDAARDYERVQKEAGEIVREKLVEIGSQLDSRDLKRPLALFHNSTLSSQAQIPWNEEGEPSSIRVGRQVLPVQVAEPFGQKALLFATPSAALGSVAVGEIGDEPPSQKPRLRVSGRKIQNDEVAVRFDAHGNITSIQSLEDGVEFVQPGQLANVFQLFEDKPLFWSAWDIDVFAYETRKDLVKAESFEVVERGPVRVAVESVRTVGKSTIRQRVSLGPTPGIRFDTEVDWHEEDKLLKVAFPVNVNAMRATYEIQFGHVERPTHYNTSWDLARFEVPAQKWADLSEGDRGVALLNDCKYGYDIHGNVMRLSLLRAPKAPDPECDMGLHRFTYVLYPHYGPLNYSEVVGAAYAINSPVRWAWLDPTEGETHELDPFVAIDDANLVVESVKRAEDGNGILVRLYECHNTRGRAHLTCSRPIRKAWRCNLEERKEQPVERSEDAFILEYRPFEIITLLLEPSSKGPRTSD